MNEDIFIPGEDQDELDKVVIKDNGESLISFINHTPRLIVSPTHPLFDFPRTHLARESVVEMLIKAAESLPTGLRLSIVEGYRPMSVQQAMFRHAMEQVRKDHPDLPEDQVELQAGRRAAPPHAITPPPHLTGGAVDLEIIDESGKSLDFSSPFGRTDWAQAPFNSSGLTETAYRNRELLRSILEPTGLTNYVDEWWHWSYGDNGWALRVDAEHAVYGLAPEPHRIDWVGDVSKLPK